MEMLYQFLSNPIKVVFFACLFLILLLNALQVISRSNDNLLVSDILNHKRRIWQIVGILTAMSFSILLFSYYLNIGFGSQTTIPIGYKKNIVSCNWTKFARIEDTRICGNFESDSCNYSNNYFVYELDKNKLTEFKTTFEYNSFAQKHQLPNAQEFQNYESNYNDYWNGYRFLFF